MKSRILVIGSSYVELHLEMHSLPTAESTAIEKDYSYKPGGKGGNSAVAIARMGGDSVLCTKLGNDVNAARLKNYFNENGVDSRYVSSDSLANTGISVIMHEQYNDISRRVLYQGANDIINDDDIEVALSCYPDAIHLSLDLPIDLTVRITKLAKIQGIPVFLDASPAKPGLPLEMLDNIEVVYANEKEAYIHTGIVPSDIEKALRACMLLAQRINSKYYVLRLADKGIFLYDGKYHNVIIPCNMDGVTAPSFTDTQSAAISCEYVLSRDIKHACEVGAVYAKTALTIGKIPTRAQMQKYISENSINIKL